MLFAALFIGYLLLKSTLLVGLIGPLGPIEFYSLFIGIPVLLSLFSAPSTHIQVESKDYVQYAAHIIASKNQDGKYHLDGLKSNIQIFEANAKQKATLIKVGFGALWGFWVYSFWETFRPIGNRGAGIVLLPGGVFDERVIAVSLFFVVILVLYILREGYGKSNEFIFSAIYMAIEECKQQQLLSPQKATPQILEERPLGVSQIPVDDAVHKRT